MEKSFWGIIYYLYEWVPLFLIIKRQSLSKKIEWTAPKWKAKGSESEIESARREIWEETWLNVEKLVNKWKLWTVTINFENSTFEKNVTYFLFEYKGDPETLFVAKQEWFLWIYKWMPITQILNIVPYDSLRDIYRKGYKALKES